MIGAVDGAVDGEIPAEIEGAGDNGFVGIGEMTTLGPGEIPRAAKYPFLQISKSSSPIEPLQFISPEG